MTEQNHTDHSNDESLQDDSACEGRPSDRSATPSGAHDTASSEEPEGSESHSGESIPPDSCDADSRDDADSGQREPNSPIPPLGYDGSRFDPHAPGPQLDGGPRSTAGMKASWVAVGFLLGIFSLPLVYFMYLGRDVSTRGTAFRFCLLGILIAFIADLAFLHFYGGDAASLLSAYSGSTTGVVGSSSGSAF